MEQNNKIEIPEELMIGLYVIMCNVPYWFSGYEVYEKAKENMSKAQKFILDWGRNNNIDPHGSN